VNRIPDTVTTATVSRHLLVAGPVTDHAALLGSELVERHALWHPVTPFKHAAGARPTGWHASLGGRALLDTTDALLFLHGGLSLANGCTCGWALLHGAAALGLHGAKAVL
jgi:hypothetical protein